MFQPSREEVRRFFCDAWARHRSGSAATPLERIAIACMLEHPEYHDLLADLQGALAMDFPVEGGRENPFLHLSMHLSLEEQSAIDQPPGIRGLLEALQLRHGDRHAAAHAAMQCLGEVLWRAQRGSLPADMSAINHDYLDCLRRRLGNFLGQHGLAGTRFPLDEQGPLQGQCRIDRQAQVIAGDVGVGSAEAGGGRGGRRVGVHGFPLPRPRRRQSR